MKSPPTFLRETYASQVSSEYLACLLLTCILLQPLQLGLSSLAVFLEAILEDREFFLVQAWA
jgi:hypothetical protein